MCRKDKKRRDRISEIILGSSMLLIGGFTAICVVSGFNIMPLSLQIGLSVIALASLIIGAFSVFHETDNKYRDKTANETAKQTTHSEQYSSANNVNGQISTNIDIFSAVSDAVDIIMDGVNAYYKLAQSLGWDKLDESFTTNEHMQLNLWCDIRKNSYTIRLSLFGILKNKSYYDNFMKFFKNTEWEKRGEDGIYISGKNFPPEFTQQFLKNVCDIIVKKYTVCKAIFEEDELYLRFETFGCRK